MFSSAGEIIASDFLIKKFHKTLEKNNIDLEKLKKDAFHLHQFLAQNILVKKENNKIIEEIISDQSTISPDAIFIFGNNDLIQIDLTAKICYQLCEKGKPPKKIFISGLGGHATSKHPTFCYSEAETMAHRLQEHGIREDLIVTEVKATHTGENIKFVDELMKSDPAGPFNNILIISAPIAVLRQIRSYERQSTYHWTTIYTLAPTWNEIEKHYYANYIDASINILGALREFATFLDYFSNQDYLSTRPIQNEKYFSNCKNILSSYYSILTKKQGDLLALDAVAAYFKAAFNLIAVEWMKPLSAEDIWEQSEKLHRSSTTFAQHHLDPPGLFCKTKANKVDENTIPKHLLRKTRSSDF